MHNYFRPLEVYPDRAALRHRLRGYVARRTKAGSDVTDGGSVSRHGDAFPKRAFVLSEFGGLAQLVPGHSALDHSYGYGDFDSPEAWRDAVRALLDEAESLEPSGLAGYVYTQLSDVEEEVNGLLTYDRRVNKLKP